MKKSREIKQVASNLFSLLVKRLSLILMAVVMVLVVGSKFDVASASQPNTESEIEDLAVCYAYGTDAIGRGDVLGGKNIYDDCFTRDAEITAIFPSGVSVTKYGANAWADFVADVFQGNGYTATQHLLGSIRVNIQNNNQARMSSYLHATHKLSDTSIDVANGTYVDTVIKQNGNWKISKRVLTLIDFLNLASPGSPEAEVSSTASTSASSRSASDVSNQSKKSHRPYIPNSN
ncbi:nuclear transport factor 2 family protein [Nostoc sp. LEGE 06077]|uniref:nuclear transport factor 2 family protein n=1 Tax=Nostoc sp. LEGE 06077 TaxID=915325 RepID=UPI0018810258|nr:nuclear transport factor 2 family protein [Nostoc sp. LEGE 06077]MBE9207421.1 nuclear transport factor 2 family protein [Nostoc sp. LEGE 06077]